LKLHGAISVVANNSMSGTNYRFIRQKKTVF
jgi:hypothetical protein